MAGAGRRMEDGKPVPIKPDGSHCSGCPYIDDNDSYYKGNFGNEACKKHKKCEKGYGSVEFPRRDKDSVGKKYSDYVSLTDKCHDDYDKKKYEVITENGVNIWLKLTKEAKKKENEYKIALEKEKIWNENLELVGLYLRWGCVLIILGIIYKLFIKKKWVHWH